jgi:hypothetical protein
LLLLMLLLLLLLLRLSPQTTSMLPMLQILTPMRGDLSETRT